MGVVTRKERNQRLLQYFPFAPPDFFTYPKTSMNVVILTKEILYDDLMATITYGSMSVY